jgi:4'-phosphopantetheinyl transferase
MLWQKIKNFSDDFPILKNNQVHIWRICTKRKKHELAIFLSLLNLSEKERANNFLVEHAKNNFIVARGVLRQLLARYLQIKPQAIEFQYNEYGKLFIEPALINFNLSHAHDFVLLAFVFDKKIGIDIELLQNNVDFINIAQRFFSPQESTALIAMPKEQQLEAFFNCWSRKEAVIKTTGKGIFFGLDKFSVEISNKRTGRVGISFNETSGWSLEALDPAWGYVGAFATHAEVFVPYDTYFYELVSQ